MNTFFSDEILLANAIKSVGAGAATVGVTGAGIGIGLVFGSFLTSFSTNPELEKQLFSYTILGFVLSESIALFALMMSFFTIFMLFLIQTGMFKGALTSKLYSFGSRLWELQCIISYDFFDVFLEKVIVEYTSFKVCRILSSVGLSGFLGSSFIIVFFKYLINEKY